MDQVIPDDNDAAKVLLFFEIANSSPVYISFIRILLPAFYYYLAIFT